MRTLVDAEVVATLRGESSETVRLYAAACAERTMPLFLGLRAGDSGREADVDFFVESVQHLWCADRALPDAPARVRRLERFPELRPCDEGISGVAGTYALFAALVLRYALLANGSAAADDAAACGHAALTAMGMLDQNLGGSAFRAQEERLQLLSVSDDVAGLWEASVEAGRERFRAVLGRTVRH